MNIRRIYQLLKNVYHWGQSHLWRVWYGRPERFLKLYAVTGTNGKTTTCYLLASILEARYGRDQVGMLTTVAFRIGNEETFNETKMTTLKSRLVWKYLRAMQEAGVKHVALEVTSHALDQKRLAGMRLSGAIWLNVQREHLDYHGTMERYAAAKAKIVKYLRVGAPLVVKKDDIWIRKVLLAQDLHTNVTWFTSKEARDVQVGLAGAVNQENAFAASKLAKALGIKEKFVERGLVAVRQVPGRMEWVSTAGKGFEVVIDYAVTPDALERLYADMRARADKSGGRVLGLLGAAGLRDRGKRPDMAGAVARHADVLVISREDPWTEDEEQIFSDLEKGLKGVPVEWKRIVDRREALVWLLGQAKRGDIVVVTGKGAERGMGVGKKVIPWNDREVIKDLLQELT